MGLDSVEIVMEAERLFNIELPDEKVTHIYKFGEFADCVHRECVAKGYDLSRDQIAKDLRRMISQFLAVDEAKITSDSRFIEDLGMN